MKASPASSADRGRRRRSGPAGAADIRRADRFTASPRQTKVRRIAWPYVPLRRRPRVIPIWISVGVGRPLEVAQLQGRGRGPRGIVLVGDRRAEHPVQVGALVAEGQLQDVAAVAGHDPLGLPDEAVELRDRVGVVVVVDAGEAQEDGVRRPQLGQELAATGPQPVVHGRQQPRADERLVERRRLDDVDSSARPRVSRSTTPNAGRRSGSWRDLADPDPIAQRVKRRGVEHDLALLGVMLGVGQVVDEGAGEHVDELDVGVADHEPSRRADRDRHLERELDRGAAGCRDRPTRAIASCIASAAAVARVPSSPSSQHVMASPEK